MAKYYVTSITKISKQDNIPAFYTHSDTHTHANRFCRNRIMKKTLTITTSIFARSNNKF